MANVNQCPLCESVGKGQNVQIRVDAQGSFLDSFVMECPLCGTYAMDDLDFDIHLKSKTKKECIQIASLLNERRLSRKGAKEEKLLMLMVNDAPHPPYNFNYFRWSKFRENYPAEVPQQIDRGLVNLGHMSTKPGDPLLHSKALHLSLFTDDPTVAAYLLDEMASMGFVEHIKGDSGKTGVRIRTKGWERIKITESSDTPPNLTLPNGPWSVKWNIKEPLGKGGQGQTYIVVNRQEITAPAVLKVLKNQGDSEARTRMFSEVSNLRKLTAIKAKVPAVLDTNVEKFQEQGIPLYFVMEKIEGETLKAFIARNGPMELGPAAALVTDICKTIKTAHDAGVYHRDLKPMNIMVRDAAKSDCVLLDYGLSFNTEDYLSVTRRSEGIGNEFMSLPELTVHMGDRRDPCSDITVICGLLYYCLTGHIPSQLRDAHGRAPHNRPDQGLPVGTIPAATRSAFNVLFDKGFSATILDRFQTADELLERITHALQPLRSSKEDTKTLAKRLSEELKGANTPVRAANFVPSTQHVWKKMQEYYVKWNSELDSFSLGSSTHGTTVLLPDRAKVITPHVYICQVRAKGHELCLNWGHAFGLEGGQVVIFKSPISKTAPSNYFNQNPAKELKRVHWYTSPEPTDEELGPLYADLDDSIQQAITELHRILMPSE